MSKTICETIFFLQPRWDWVNVDLETTFQEKMLSPDHITPDFKNMLTPLAQKEPFDYHLFLVILPIG